MSKSQSPEEQSIQLHEASPYLSHGFKNLNNIVRNVHASLRHNFDFIVCGGVSGLLVGGPISYLTGLPLVVVRKTESQFGKLVEGDVPNYGSYIIIDDFVVSGNTVKYMQSEIAKVSKAKCDALYLWNNDWYPCEIDIGLEVIACTYAAKGSKVKSSSIG